MPPMYAGIASGIASSQRNIFRPGRSLRSVSQAMLTPITVLPTVTVAASSSVLLSRIQIRTCSSLCQASASAPRARTMIYASGMAANKPTSPAAIRRRGYEASFISGWQECK